MNVGRDRLRIRPGRKGLKRSGAIMDVHAVLLYAPPSLKTMSLLTGHSAIVVLQQLLEPQAIVPSPPYFVRRIGTPRNERDVVENRVYLQAETMGLAKFRRGKDINFKSTRCWTVYCSFLIVVVRWSGFVRTDPNRQDSH
jgi:hypothetical protein